MPAKLRNIFFFQRPFMSVRVAGELRNISCKKHVKQQYRANGEVKIISIRCEG